jgi:hypothetical protein
MQLFDDLFDLAVKRWLAIARAGSHGNPTSASG